MILVVDDEPVALKVISIFLAKKLGLPIVGASSTQGALEVLKGAGLKGAGLKGAGLKGAGLKGAGLKGAGAGLPVLIVCDGLHGEYQTLSEKASELGIPFILYSGSYPLILGYQARGGIAAGKPDTDGLLGACKDLLSGSSSP